MKLLKLNLSLKDSAAMHKHEISLKKFILLQSFGIFRAFRCIFIALGLSDKFLLSWLGNNLLNSTLWTLSLY